MRHVILVGATHGIGLALAEAYAERSWRVGLVGRSAPLVRQEVERLRQSFPGTLVQGGVLDVTRRDQVAPTLDALVVALGQVDLLVYCAGVMDEGPKATPRMLDVNVRGAVDVLEWGAARLVEAGEGRLAAVGSVAGDRGRKGNPVWVRTRMLGAVPGFPPSVAPSRAAELIVRGLDAGRDVFYVPRWWWMISQVLQTLPRPIFKRMAPP